MNPARAPCCLGFLFVVSLSTAARAETRVVTVPNTSVRSAPFDVAPEVARLQAGDRLTADDQPQGEWRRVVLPNGRSGFVRDGATQRAEAPPENASAEPSVAVPGAPVPVPPAPVPVPPASEPSPPVLAQQAQESPPPAGPPLLGVTFDLFPVGTLSGSSGASNDSVFAVGTSAFVDGAVTPYLALGVSPQVIFRVKPDGLMDESAKEIDLRARLTGRLPVSPRVRAFARLSPGYSLIDFPSVQTRVPVDRPRPTGFVMDFSVGTEIAVVPRLSIVSGLGYQMGFQSSSEGEFHTSYLHLGAGFAVGL